MILEEVGHGAISTQGGCMLTRFFLSTCALLLFASPAWAGGVA